MRQARPPARPSAPARRGMHRSRRERSPTSLSARARRAGPAHRPRQPLHHGLLPARAEALHSASTTCSWRRPPRWSRRWPPSPAGRGGAPAAARPARRIDAFVRDPPRADRRAAAGAAPAARARPRPAGHLRPAQRRAVRRVGRGAHRLGAVRWPARGARSIDRGLPPGRPRHPHPPGPRPPGGAGVLRGGGGLPRDAPPGGPAGRAGGAPGRPRPGVPEARAVLSRAGPRGRLGEGERAPPAGRTRTTVVRWPSPSPARAAVSGFASRARPREARASRATPPRPSSPSGSGR